MTLSLMFLTGVQHAQFMDEAGIRHHGLTWVVASNLPDHVDYELDGPLKVRLNGNRSPERMDRALRAAVAELDTAVAGAQIIPFERRQSRRRALGWIAVVAVASSALVVAAAGPGGLFPTDDVTSDNPASAPGGVVAQLGDQIPGLSLGQGSAASPGGAGSAVPGDPTGGAGSGGVGSGGSQVVPGVPLPRLGGGGGLLGGGLLGGAPNTLPVPSLPDLPGVPVPVPVPLPVPLPVPVPAPPPLPVPLPAPPRLPAVPLPAPSVPDVLPKLPPLL